MAGQLRRILPGVAVGGTKHRQNHVIHRVSILIPDSAVCTGIARHTGHRLAVGRGEHTRRNGKRIRTGNPDHGDTPHGVGGGDGCNG